MTEAEWLEGTEAYQPLIYARQVASIRKLRLISAALARWLFTLPDYLDAKPCDDLIERVADHPVSFQQLEGELYARPGTWSLSKTLGPDERVGQELNRMVWLAENDLRERTGGSPQKVHTVALSLLREVVGNPFRLVAVDPSWLTSTVVSLARQMYESRDFSTMPILADALQDAECDKAEILRHCRQPGEHVRGCWVVDLIAGRK